MVHNMDMSKYYKRQIIPRGLKKALQRLSEDSGRRTFYLNKWDDGKWGNGIFHQRKEVLILKSWNNRCDKSHLKKILWLCNKNTFPSWKNVLKKKRGWFQTSKNESSELWLVQKEYLHKVLSTVSLFWDYLLLVVYVSLHSRCHSATVLL